MTSLQYTLFCAVMGALAAQPLFANVSGWLSPKATEDNPYTFLNQKGTTITLPSAAYAGWKVFNATSEAAEMPQDYLVSSAEDEDNVGDGMLRFQGLDTEGKAYLALGISQNPGGEQNPVSLESIPGKLRIDNIHAKVRFVECSETPSIKDLMEMYPSYAETKPTPTGLAPFTAAKLGICVGDDGYFRVSRVRSTTANNPETGMAEDYDYEFCKSKHAYATVGGGEVIVRIEFYTYEGPDASSFRRAFRIWVKDANGEANEGKEICVTEKLGYPWQIENGIYQFDFKTVEQGDWLYAVDDAIAAAGGHSQTGDGRGMMVAPLDALNHLAFSATDGGFYAAWMSQKVVDDAATLSTYATGAFTPFVSTFGAHYDLYVDWASKYNVTLTKWLDNGVQTFSASTTDWTQHAFDAFLLYMDPETNEALRLRVTGVVPDEDTISFTVVGPEGCNLQDAVTRAARLRIRRAATLAEMATAEAQEYDILFSADGATASFTVPKIENEVEQPFMQATLVPVTDCE